MISQIHIENFQSHENTKLELVPGINVVVGASDSGKTAIVRALRWLVWNKPGGDSFRSTWGGETSVVVKLATGNLVRRIRTAKTNEYSIDEQVFHAFGTEPPEDVQTTLNLDEINLQQQLDRPFLLDSSPGQVAQYLNSVAHLDVIDIALSKINGQVRTISSNIRSLQDQQSKLEESVASYAYLPDMEKDVTDLEQKAKELSAIQVSQKALSKALEASYAVNESLVSTSRLTLLAEPVTRALATFKDLSEKRKARQALIDLTEHVGDLSDELGILEHLRGLRPEVEQAEQVLIKYKEKQNYRDKLYTLIMQIDKTLKSMDIIEDNVVKWRKQFNTAMGDTCQLCGNPFSET